MDQLHEEAVRRAKDLKKCKPSEKLGRIGRGGLADVLEPVLYQLDLLSFLTPSADVLSPCVWGRLCQEDGY